MMNEFEIMLKNSEGMFKLSKDLKAAAKSLSPDEARYFVDNYYMIQEYRKAAGNQVGALRKSGEPNELVSWLFNQAMTLETSVKKILEVYTTQHALGVWCKSITGIGPVLSAGLLAHIDITKAPTAGHIWSYAGYNPNIRWTGADESKKLVKTVLGKSSGKINMDDITRVAGAVNRKPDNIYKSIMTGGKQGEPLPFTVDSLIKTISRRPWNARLRTLCWKIGESFIKTYNHPRDIYGKLYIMRKTQEIEANERLGFKQQADELVENATSNYKKTEAYKHYNLEGKLSPGHINSRARRYAVKIFLAHFQEAAYWSHYKKAPPNPYVIDHLGHKDKIEPPNMHIIFDDFGFEGGALAAKS